MKTIYYLTEEGSTIKFSPQFPLSIIYEIWLESRKQGKRTYIHTKQVKEGEEQFWNL